MQSYRRIVCLIVSFILILSGETSGAHICEGLFSTESQKQNSTDHWFDLDAFTAQKQKFQDKLRRKEKVDPSQLTDQVTKLALSEAIGQERGWDLLNLSGAGNDPKQSQKIFKFFKGLSFDQGITAFKLRKILTRLYVISNSPPKRVSLLISDAEESLIQRRIGMAFLRVGFSQAVQDIGLVRDPSLFESLRKFSARHSNSKNLLLAVALNGWSLSTIGFPVYAPTFTLANPRLHLAANGVRNLIVAAMIGTAVSMATQMFPILEVTVSAAFTSEERLAQIQDATFNAQRIREEQFNSWKEAFRAFEGRYPDPQKYPQDAAEWNREWNKLINIPDEQLKVQFQREKKSTH